MIVLLVLGYVSLGVISVWINPIDVRGPLRWFALPLLVAIWPLVTFAWLNSKPPDEEP